MSGLGTRIKYLRLERNLSQKDLGALCGITTAAISRYESGKRIPRSDIIAKIAKALDSSIDYILIDNKEEDSGEENVRLSSAVRVIGMAQTLNEITPKQADVLVEIAQEAFGDNSRSS